MRRNISVDRVGKFYKFYKSNRSRLLDLLTPYANKDSYEIKWALRDISFAIEEGKSLGIVGVNGSGKSTLLKLIAGVIKPSEGSVAIDGRVAALLELGMGFQANLTGLENIYMAGLLLGYGNDEIGGMVNDIIGFADIGEYINHPIRTYSSGMLVRLAFSVATAKCPEVLIIDEALSVGDASFQRKCFQRIEHFKESGATLLFVSHDIESVRRLCDAALFINSGRQLAYGSSKLVCDEYDKFIHSKNNYFQVVASSLNSRLNLMEVSPKKRLDCEISYGNGYAEIVDAWIADEQGKPIDSVACKKNFKWIYKVKFNKKIDKPIFAMMIKTVDGLLVNGVDTSKLTGPTIYPAEGSVYTIEFLIENNLSVGVYYFNCGVRSIIEGEMQFLHRRIDVAILKVTDSQESTASIGFVDLSTQVSISVG